MELLLYVTCLLAVLPFAHAKPYNVTVDDTDPAVTWSGNWAQTLPGFGMTANGTYMTAKNDPNAYAEFKFTGVAVYFVSAKWPYDVSTRITLNPESPDAQPLVMDLSDYSAESKGENYGRAMYLASAQNLEYKEHTVRVDVAPGSSRAIFDAFVYTALQPTDRPVIHLSSQPQAFRGIPDELVEPFIGPPLADIPRDRYREKKLNLVPIIAPICSVVGVLMIGAVLFFFYRKRRVAKVDPLQAASAAPKGKHDDDHAFDMEKGGKFDDDKSSVASVDLPVVAKTYENGQALSR